MTRRRTNERPRTGTVTSLVWAGMLLNAAGAFAGIPNPKTSSVAVTGQGAPCQFRFSSLGGLDEMIVLVTVRGAFYNPIPYCSTKVTLEPNAATVGLCNCGPMWIQGFSSSEGTFDAVFDRIGGRGELDVRVSTLCSGSRIELARVPVAFTSPDLDGSCEHTPGSAVNVIDLGIWVGGLPPGYLQSSDYNCNGAVNVVDLGIWASGLAIGCGTSPGP